MNLKDLNIKKFYDSDSDDILNSFYIPALSVSIKYQRLAGFFSSSTLAIAARGIAELISNNGKMELICGAKLKKEDIKAIVKASKDPKSIIERSVLQDLGGIQDELISDHVKALGWMVANKLLEIKVAIVTDSDNRPLDYIEITQSGIFHQKVGILMDAEGNKISFSGSDNETATAWQSNIEEFKVFCSWEEAQRSYLEADCNKFSKFWNGRGKRVNVIDIPQAVQKKLIEIAPDNIERLNLGRRFIKKGSKKIKLWKHQIEAIEKWVENDKKCLFEMATGTGKTFAALGCLKKLLKEERKLITIITCPYSHIMKQWEGDLNEFGIQTDSIIADSTNPKWKHQIMDYIRDINNDICEKLVIFTTHDTFYIQSFINSVNIAKCRLFLIADEVHGVGAKERKQGLINKYQFRLGLSATPSRWFDPDGTEKLLKYFNAENEKKKFIFSLEKATKTINPDTGKTYLAPYEYKPYFVELTDEELEEYIIETEKIARLYLTLKDEEEKQEYLNLLCIKRQSIIKNATNKYVALEDILEDIKQDTGEIKHCLIYCTPQQIDTVQDILNQKGIIQHRFTQTEGVKPEERYSGISERDYLLKKFADGDYQALIAMKCLDEGVDIPPAKTGIIMASSGNPRQYIQRRGRILRWSPNKEKAFIYDLIVIPSFRIKLPGTMVEVEKKIIGKEFMRYEEFAKIAMNRLECIKEIEDIEDRCDFHG